MMNFPIEILRKDFTTDFSSISMLIILQRFSLLVSLKKIYSFISSDVICQTLKWNVPTISSNANWSSVVNMYVYNIKFAFLISANCTCFKTASPWLWLRLWLGGRARVVKKPLGLYIYETQETIRKKQENSVNCTLCLQERNISTKSGRWWVSCVMLL